MTLNPARHPVPDNYATDRFRLRRQMFDDNCADYQAVMQSRQQLRVWSDSDWPPDNFTPEDNLSDLEMHIGEHERDEAYGFSVFDAAVDALIGSLYINPIGSIIASYQDDEHAASIVQRFDACADYWLLEGLSGEMQVDFLKTIQTWLKDAWWFKGIAFGSRRGMALQRQQYMDVGLREVAVLEVKSGTRQFFLHAS